MVGLLKSARARARDESGVGVVTALMVTLTVFVIAITWISVGLHQVGQSAHERESEQALHAAEAGLQLAANRLASDSSYTGESVTLGDGTGDFEVSVDPVDPTDPTDLRRYITSTGHSLQGEARQVEQQVELVPIIGADGFDYALFASPGGVASDNNSTILGDVYSRDDYILANSGKVFGDITSLASVTTSNNCTVGGDVWAANQATIDDSGTTVEGNVRAGGAVTVSGSILGDVQSGGSITNTGTIAGTSTPNSPPSSPPELQLPTFTWNAANYTPAPTTWSTTAAFKTYWSDNKSAFSGHHRITDTSALDLDTKWTMSGDVTIVTDGPITLSRGVDTTTSDDMTLVVVSFASTSAAISMTNNLTFPANVNMLLFTPNGGTSFSNLKDFHGAVYARDIALSNNFTLTWTPVTPPGFDFSDTVVSGSEGYDVVAEVFREVPVGS